MFSCRVFCSVSFRSFLSPIHEYSVCLAVLSSTSRTVLPWFSPFWVLLNLDSLGFPFLLLPSTTFLWGVGRWICFGFLKAHTWVPSAERQGVAYKAINDDPSPPPFLLNVPLRCPFLIFPYIPFNVDSWVKAFFSFQLKTRFFFK